MNDMPSFNPDLTLVGNAQSCPRCGKTNVKLNVAGTLATCQEKSCSQAWAIAVEMMDDDEPDDYALHNIGRCCPDREEFPFIPIYSFAEPGNKGDPGKPQVDRGVFGYWPRTLKALALVSERGAGQEGRTWGGQMEVPDGFRRYMEAHGRHVLDRHIDGEVEPSTGDLHILMIAWNILTACEHYLRDRNAPNPDKETS